MYTIEEPYANSSTPPKGTVPFFLVKDENNTTVYTGVTRAECQKWIDTNTTP
jgi:hypothetical protein